MRKPDDELKLDIAEIFGGDWVRPSGPPTADVSPRPEPQTAVESPVESDEIRFNDLSHVSIVEPESSVSELKLGDLEAADAEVPSEATTSESSGPQDFFEAYDHFREIFLEELKDSAGTRKTGVMLVKTFELAREKYPEVFRNANWDASGNLLEDGSLNAQRMLDNKSGLDEKRADIIVDTALIFLMNLRLQAVEKGLGPEFARGVRMRLRKWADETSRKNGSGKEDPKILRRLSHYLL